MQLAYNFEVMMSEKVREKPVMNQKQLKKGNLLGTSHHILCDGVCPSCGQNFSSELCFGEGVL